MIEAVVGSKPEEAWEPARSVAARLAMGSLAKFLPKSLARNGRVQAEALFCTVGALAGFAAQHAVRQEHVVDGKAKESEVFVIALAPNGERYFFGDRLNAVLIPERLDGSSIFSILGGEVLRLGTAGSELPDCHDIFERATKSIGTPAFGIPQLPADHKSFLTPRRAIEIFWPSVQKALTREPIMPVPDFALVPPRHWPLLLAAVAASYMGAMKAALPPALAMRICMEAAIPMSKIDQSAVRFVGATEH